MPGGKIFQKPSGAVDYYDRITVAGYSFDASIRVKDKSGDPSAIHCGRIVSFEMTCGGEFVAYYDDGKWYILPENPMEDAFNEAAVMARDILISKWSQPDRIRVTKCEMTDLF